MSSPRQNASVQASWRARLSEGVILPYFQPILSVETGTIAGFEALGRHQIGAEVHSLGTFFETQSKEAGLNDLRKEVDRSLRRQALTAFAAQPASPTRLFLNVNPRLMIEHLDTNPEDLPWTLQVLAELGLDPSRVVIEFTEQAIGAETASLRAMVNHYRRLGCAIAVDDVGAEASNLDRIGFFEPDIIKIDALMLRRSLRERSFQQVLAGLATMAEGLGAALLFEGVETSDELHQALRFGARFLQGYYFAQAAPEFLPEQAFVSLLKPELVRFGQDRGRDIADQDRRLEEVRTVLSRSTPRISLQEGRILLDPTALEPWNSVACRVYLTDSRGFQISPNYGQTEELWVADETALGRCRITRPYFRGEAVPRRHHPQLWSVSEPYYDANDRSLLRTWGRFLQEEVLLFVDVLEIEKAPRSG